MRSRPTPVRGRRCWLPAAWRFARPSSTIYRAEATADLTATGSLSGADADSDAVRPAVSFVHGGSWTVGATGQFACYALDFASADWIPVERRYRRVNESPFPAQVDISHAAVDWIGEHVDEYGGDIAFGTRAGATLPTLLRYGTKDGVAPPEQSKRYDS